MTKATAITATMEYDSYPFDSYGGATALDDIYPKGSAQATRIYRFSLEGKFTAPSRDRFSLYLVIGASYAIEHIATIQLTNRYLRLYAEVPGQNKFYWMQTFGLGWRCNIVDSFGIDLTGKLLSDYRAHIHESIMFGFFYIL